MVPFVSWDNVSDFRDNFCESVPGIFSRIFSLECMPMNDIIVHSIPGSPFGRAVLMVPEE